MQVPNCGFGGFNGGKELFVDMMQPGMLIPQSAPTVILVQLVDKDVSEERTAIIFSVHTEAGECTRCMIFVPKTR